MSDKAKKDESEFIADVLERFSKCVEADDNDRQDADEDVKFLAGDDQWDSLVKGVREEASRPCLTINKLPSFVDTIVGEQRMNRPSIKVVGVDSKSDPEIANILTGLVRNIETQSDAEVAYDTAFESAVACGRGVFKITTEYANDNTFDQDIKIERIPNPFTFYFDPGALKLDLSDANYMFLTEMMDSKEFERRFPDHQKVDFNQMDDSKKPWFTKDQVRVAEYWERTFEESTIYLLSDGSVTDQKPEEKGMIRDQRKQQIPRIQSYYVSGMAVLDGPNEWPGRMFPVIPVWGKELWVDGERRLRGAIRHAKDACRMYNYFRSVSVETVAMSPKDPWIMSGEQIGPYAAEWEDAHIKTYAYLLYSHKDGQPPPYRAGPPQLSTAIAAEIAVADQDMRDTTNMHETQLGMVSNEKSGRAIKERRMSGDRGNFPFMDNLTRALRHAGRVLVDLIPKIYDHDRIVRIMGEDGSENFVPVNVQPHDPSRIMQQMAGKQIPGTVDPRTLVLNDLSVGKYDVVVTTGPSYSTQREESAEAMVAFAQAVPQAAPLIADLIANSMDWPDSQKIAARLKKTVPPDILGKDEIDEEEGPPKQKDPMQDPAIAMKMVELQLKREELEIKAMEAVTKGILNIAKAEGVEAGQQLQMYQTVLDQIKMKYEGRRQDEEMSMQQQQSQAGPGPQLPQ